MKKYLFLSASALITFLIPSAMVSQQNVGIGTPTPAYRLDVQGNPTTPGAINLYSKVNYVGSTQVTAVEGYSKPGDGVGYGGRFTGGYRGLEGYGSGGTYGFASIGVYGNATGSTGNRMGVYGDASGGTNNYGIYGFVGGGANHYAVYGSCPNILGYAGYFNGRGYFDEDLNVNNKIGIGTNATPTTKLQILNGSDVSLTTNGFVQLGATNNWNLILDDNEIMARNNGVGNDLLFQQDAGNILMCGLEQGKVGIGVQLASNLPTGYMLAVDGKIISEELRIQNSDAWPDYVFADHYDLMPLEELERSISINKHLPNIPSADVVAQDGILIGDMQKRMMEKIEELTLYILKLNETNKQQQIEIDELKKAMNNRQ